MLHSKIRCLLLLLHVERPILTIFTPLLDLHLLCMLHAMSQFRSQTSVTSEMYMSFLSLPAI